MSTVSPWINREGMSAPARVAIDALLPSDSPRLSGEDPEYTRLLAELDIPLPSIVVHRSTMRVIDGMYRLRAARLRDQTHVDVTFFDGAAEDAFVFGVKANIEHGLPLSLADREAAAMRIVASHPHWSDRSIATAAGLSAKTIAAIRVRSTVEPPRLNVRIGKDGRARPIDPSDGRRRASAVIEAEPGASLRDIASKAGVALGTARDVRERMKRGEDPFPPRIRNRSIANSPERTRRRSGTSTGSAAGLPAATQDRQAVLQTLMRDPSLRFTDQGRDLLRWLGACKIVLSDCESVLDAVPSHCTPMVIGLARECAEVWRELADELEQRRRRSSA